MDGHSVSVWGIVLTIALGSVQSAHLVKRSSEHAIDLDLETQLSRVKRVGVDGLDLSRVKRQDDVVELSRVKRGDTEEEASLSRQKRYGDFEQDLSRVKRGDFAKNVELSRQKRRDLTDEESVALSRQKRRDLGENLELSRVKRDDSSISRVETDQDVLSRVKRVQAAHSRIRRSNTDAEKANSEPAKLEKEKDEKRDTPLENKSVHKPEMQKVERKRGYWEKRTRGDYLLHRASKRYHKRRNTKRGKVRFMKRKSFIAKQKARREAKMKKSEEEFVKKSMDKKAEH